MHGEDMRELLLNEEFASAIPRTRAEFAFVWKCSLDLHQCDWRERLRYLTQETGFDSEWLRGNKNRTNGRP